MSESAGSAEATYSGRSLAEVVRLLKKRGLNLIFSSAVVDEHTQVTVEPVATDPRAILEEILAPLGLEARDGPAGSILIVRSAGWIETGTIRGRVLSSAQGAPIPAAAVRVLGTSAGGATRADGTFEIARVPAGTYDVQIEATG
ncbi:MAG TPA: carboxypeptidase regulatory-like domain-containing protein, partial [Candidatus Polarisedimenticolaceae bacterium]|nr:carboxypeptidase regulatory-like domain-containing protein [Candidatus Polarisedimenticolaceae bacterium]